MLIAGGTYVEECASPRFIALLGSGGRAALALQNLTGTVFHTFYHDSDEIIANFGANAVTHRSATVVKFNYLHPLARPQVSISSAEWSSASVVGNVVLRFGCLEGEFVVEAERAVYDPQGSNAFFRANGSVAERLIVVLNADEAVRLAGDRDLAAAGATILECENAEAVVIKRGTAGALIISPSSEPLVIPAFRTSIVNKIGSGDIFSAMIAYYWGHQRIALEKAVELASRQTADYVQTRILERPEQPPSREAAFGLPESLKPLIVADDQTTPALWLIDEACSALYNLGVADILVADGNLGLPEDIWLCDRNAVLALPQIYNGFALSIARAARDQGIPAVAFSEGAAVQNAFLQAGAQVSEDFAGSVYSIIWSQS